MAEAKTGNLGTTKIKFKVPVRLAYNKNHPKIPSRRRDKMV